MEEKNLVSSKRVFEEARAALIERLQTMSSQDVMNMFDYSERLIADKGAKKPQLCDAQLRDFKLKLFLFNRDAGLDAEYSEAFEKQTAIPARSVTGLMFDGFCLGFDAAFDLWQDALQ